MTSGRRLVRTFRPGWPTAIALAIAVAPVACRTLEKPPSPEDTLQSARDAADHATRMAGQRQATAEWLRCAASAWRAMQIAAAEPASSESASLSTRCTDEVLARAFAQRAHGWKPGQTRVEGIDIDVEFRDLSPDLQWPLTVARAADIDMVGYGDRHSTRGFGVALAVMSARCKGMPRCDLNPPEGVFRPATAWFEQDADDEIPTLVLTDPLRHPVLASVSGDRPLSLDTSAPFALGAGTSKLKRLGVWGLLGGREIGRRAGVFLLDEYDPNKRAIVMIHGLGSSPLIWGRVSNAIWADPLLRARYQIWHVVYQTDPPLLVVRLRVQRYLDAAWRVLDPECDDPARTHVVLIGHSLGGVVSRLLSVDSGQALWDAAFVVPPDQLRGDPEELATLDAVFPGNPRAAHDRAAKSRGRATRPATRLRTWRDQQHLDVAAQATRANCRRKAPPAGWHSVPHDRGRVAGHPTAERWRRAARQREHPGCGVDTGARIGPPDLR